MKKITIYLIFSNLFLISLGQETKSENITEYIRGVYQQYISGIRGGSCPMYPSCSNYGLDQFRKNGLTGGFLHVPDRLMRCGHEHELYSLTLQNNTFKLLDPVEMTNFSHLIYSSPKKIYPINDTIPDNKESLLIKELIKKELLNEALIEMIRYKLKNGSLSNELSANYINILRKLNRHEDAIFDFENDLTTDNQQHPMTNYQMAWIWNELKSTDKELHYLKIFQKSFAKNDLEYQKSLMLEASALHKNNKKKEAVTVFGRIPKNSQYYSKSQEKIVLINSFKKEKFKNPALGTVLGAVPGLGYLYANHKLTAISALILNSVLMYATYTSVNVRNYGMAGLTGLFATSFYISSIVGSNKSVKRYNNKKIENYNKKVEVKY